LFSLIQSFYNISLSLTKTKVRVLCYHRINKYGDWFGIDTDIFDQQVKYLSKNFNFITIRDFLKILNNEIYIEKALLLTFDDGYKDNYTDAFPILKKYSAPAIIFLTTDFIDGKMWMWQDIYRFIVNTVQKKNANITIDGINLSFDFSSYEGKMKARRNIDFHCNKMIRSERLSFLHLLANNLQLTIPNLPTEEYAPLSWTQVRELAKGGIDFGAHSQSHERLSKLNVNDCYNEIIRSKKKIEMELNKEINAFSYPNGLKEDFTDEIKKMVSKSGFSCAFTMIEGMNSMNSDKYELARFSPANEYSSYFIAEVFGLNIWKQKIKNLRKDNS